MWLWILGGIALVAVFAVAAVVVGREARRLDAIPPRPVIDLDDAVDWVADNLPPEVTAELSYEDVEQLLRWHVEWFKGVGVAPAYDPSKLGDPVDDLVVVERTEATAVLVDRAAAAGRPMRADHVQAVVDAHLRYLEAAGAVLPAGDLDGPELGAGPAAPPALPPAGGADAGDGPRRPGGGLPPVSGNGHVPH